MEFRHEHCSKFFWTEGIARFCPYCGCLISNPQGEDVEVDLLESLLSENKVKKGKKKSGIAKKKR